MEEKLIKIAVRNMKKFGYEHVDHENIFTDEVYKLFFKNMLKENLGMSKDIDASIQKLLSKISK